jgi:hypothetical protein
MIDASSKFLQADYAVGYFAANLQAEKTKRPPGNRAASSSRENSSNGGKFPSKLSAQIL